LYYFRIYRLFFLQKKEKIAWQRYIQRFRVWYNLYRYLYSAKDISCILTKKKNLQFKQYSKNINYSQKLRNFTFLAKTNVISSSVTLGNSSLSGFFKMRKMRLHLKNKLTFNNLFFETNFAHVLPWRSRKFWTIRAYSSLYTKRVFFKRFYTFRLERGFIRKNSKAGHTAKRVNFLSYSHERFHKFRLFYTTLGYRQFQQLFLKLKHFKKYAAAVIISILEFRAEFFLYRLNFAPSKYFAKQMIARGAFAANGHVFTNKNFRFSIGDAITVTDSSFNLIFDSILNRVRSIRGLSIKSSTKLTPSIPLFFNNPGYVEMDYCLLNAIIFKKPKITDVFVPNYLELDPLNRNLAHIYNSYL
jgi:ribosomal protein S4